jgi:hypothetical protein
MPPSLVEAKKADGSVLGIAAVVPLLIARPMLRVCAENAFRGVTCPNMQRLVIFLDIEYEVMPKLEFGLVSLLVKECLPGRTDAEYAEIYGRRHFKSSAKPLYQTFLSTEAVQSCADVLGESNTAEVVKEMNEYKRKVDAMKSMTFGPSSSATGDAKPEDNNKAKKKMGVKDKDHLDLTRAYLPPGATLSLETEWDTRFRVTYPTLFLPAAIGKSYDETSAVSRRAAVSYLCVRAWKQHILKKPNEVCPYKLD